MRAVRGVAYQLGEAVPLLGEIPESSAGQRRREDGGAWLIGLRVWTCARETWA